MSDFDPVQFGITMGQLTAEYRTRFAWLAPIPHIVFLLLLILLILFGNRFRKALTIYFSINYLWVLIFVGGWFSIQVYRLIGYSGLAMYIGTPVMLIVILLKWIQELRKPGLDLELSKVKLWRWLITIPMMLWGFWYPPYIWGVGLVYDPKEFLFGAYGLMGCPTTMVPLTLLFLKYPEGNKSLFHALTAYAVIIGFAMTALKYVPDIPFFAMGIISLLLIFFTNMQHKIKKEAI